MMGANSEKRIEDHLATVIDIVVGWMSGLKNLRPHEAHGEILDTRDLRCLIFEL